MRILLLLISVCTTINLFGQEPAETSTFLDSIVLDEFRITAQYKPTHYKKAIHAIDIINTKELRSRGVMQLDEALVSAPTIRLNQDPVLGTRVSMRGIGASNVAILIDGIPVIGRLNGAIDVSQIPMQNIERIEVVEGPLSAIYGNNAAGGVINIITKKSSLKPISFTSNHQWESLGILNNQASLSWRKSAFSGQVYGRYYNYDQFPVDSLRIIDQFIISDGTKITQSRYPWNPKSQYSYGTKFHYRPAEDHKITFNYDRANEYITDFGSIKRPQFKPYAQDFFYTTDRYNYGLHYDGRIHDTYFIEATVGYNDYRRITDEKRTIIEQDTFDKSLSLSDTTNFETYFTRAQIGFSAFDDWEFMLGLNITSDRARGDRIYDSSRKDSATTQIDEYAIYTDIKYNINKDFIASFTGRYLYNTQYSNQFTPAFLLKYNLNKNLAFRSSFAYGYRSPSLKELYLEFVDVNHFIFGNPDLQPEISTDIQVSGRYSSKNFNAGLTLYRTNIQNKIDLVEIGQVRFTYENISEYTVQGATANLGFRYAGFNAKTSWSMGYWSTGLANEEFPQYGNVLDVTNTLQYTIPKTALNININHRHIGSEPVYKLVDNEVETFAVESLDLVDVSANYNFWKKRITLTAGLKNILDAKAAAISGISNGAGHSNEGSRLISRGRSIFVKVGLTF